jgi:Zn-dependent M28 family amino/carboxypeptidase
MRALPLTLALTLLASGAFARSEESGPATAAAAVEPAALEATITRLVAFGTRHTLSDTASPSRGIGAARRWAAGRFETLAAACGGCLTVVTPGQTFTGDRVPTPTRVEDVIAIQRGASDPGRVVIISGHIDSRNSDPLDGVRDAPGANDDGSGTAAVLEAARVLSRHRFPASIVYAVLSGEEQGLYGGQVLAAYAKAQGWRVEAALNNDIIGNSHGIDGRVVADEVRVFSEGVRVAETPAEAAIRRRSGGENDSASRNLARFMSRVAEKAVPGLRVKMIARSDRFSRGGDQLPMQDAGFTAVRVTEADENYDRQHQDVRVDKGRAYGDVLSGVDFPYLAKVTRLNVATLAALAAAPAPPGEVKLAGAVTPNSTLTWTASPGATAYRVWWRDTDAAQWTAERSRKTSTVSLALPGVNIDDFAFGVSAISADGAESPVEFPGPAGAFTREVAATR